MLTEAQREYQRDWYYKNQEKRKESARNRQRKWRALNADAARKACRDWQKRNPEQIRDASLRRTYGISLVEWNALFAKQEEKCAICRGVAKTQRHWHLDHCHDTRKIRGILCNHCNLMIGHAKDNPSVLIAASEYLRK